MGDVKHCTKCGELTYVTPLHGDKGGPLFCPLCAGAWNAEYTKRRKWGRIIVKAMKAYEREGGSWSDFNNLKLAAMGFDVMFLEADTLGADPGDITTELLDDAIQLTHPDRHPPERRELAKRVTEDLLALRPFVFPAPKQKAAPESLCDAFSKTTHGAFEEVSRSVKESAYPCKLCVNEVSYNYCTACRAEWDKRRREKQERLNEKQRKWYAYRQHIRRLSRPPITCKACGGKVEAKRKDAAYCSAVCRQRAYRQRVDARNTVARNGGTSAVALVVNARKRGSSRKYRTARSTT